MILVTTGVPGPRAAEPPTRRVQYDPTDMDRLFTPRFFVMCGFTFTVFLSAFQLLPTAPFHILDLGGSTFASGLFLGFLTYSSAFSAPLTGAFADRIGHRRMLIISSVALAVFAAAYAVISDYRWVLALAIVQGVFWSGLLSASAAYMTQMLPERRRAEGIGYWGLSTMAALSVAPSVGFVIYRYGWVWLCVLAGVLNLVMLGIALSLEEQPTVTAAQGKRSGPLLEWRVLVTSLTLFLYSFGYGGITSFAAMYADASGTTPKGIYLTALAIVVLCTRPFTGHLGDRIGYKRVFVPCLVMISIGLACLAVLDADVGADLRARIRDGLSELRRLRDARRVRRTARRGIRRDPGGIRYRDRHRLDVDRLAHSAIRFPRRVRGRGGVIGSCTALFSGDRSGSWRRRRQNPKLEAPNPNAPPTPKQVASRREPPSRAPFPGPPRASRRRPQRRRHPCG
jgi:MFS family permease